MRLSSFFWVSANSSSFATKHRNCDLQLLNREMDEQVGLEKLGMVHPAPEVDGGDVGGARIVYSSQD